MNFMVYHPIQKYKFESKSQPTFLVLKLTQVVYHPIQKYKFESKSQRFSNGLSNINLVYHPIQKYKFESKSQLLHFVIFAYFRCITQYKNTNLKANHNARYSQSGYRSGVSPNTKIQIWKQITTQWRGLDIGAAVYHPIQKYKFESKSQHRVFDNRNGQRCITQYKNTNLKANHNQLMAKKLKA